MSVTLYSWEPVAGTIPTHSTTAAPCAVAISPALEAALDSAEPGIRALAEGILDLTQTRDEWHADMRRHRRNIAG